MNATSTIAIDDCDGEPCCERMLVDVRMPGTSGVELVRLLRKRGCPVKRVALASGISVDGLEDEAESLGVEVLDKLAGFDGFFGWLKAP